VHVQRAKHAWLVWSAVAGELQRLSLAGPKDGLHSCMSNMLHVNIVQLISRLTDSLYTMPCCRAKKRNMERLTLACGGFAINSVEELSPECLVRSAAPECSWRQCAAVYFATV
jgi:hypothetical protein